MAGMDTEIGETSCQTQTEQPPSKRFAEAIEEMAPSTVKWSDIVRNRTISEDIEQFFDEFQKQERLLPTLTVSENMNVCFIHKSC